MDTCGIIGLTLCGVGLVGMSLAMVYHNDPARGPQSTERRAPSEWGSNSETLNSLSMEIKSVADGGETGVFLNYGTMWQSELRDGDWRNDE